MKIVLFLFAYLSYFSYLCIYETGSCGHSRCAEKHEREAGVDAKKTSIRSMILYAILTVTSTN